MIIIHQKIGQIVDSIRMSGKIHGSEVLSGQRVKIRSKGKIKPSVGENILINQSDKPFEVISVETDGFTIHCDLTEINSLTWKACAPYFYRGTVDEIKSELSNLELAQIKRYPAIFLILPVDENSDQAENIACETTLWMVVATNTDPSLSFNARTEQVFKPVLNPLYEKLLAAFYFYDGKILHQPPHAKIQHVKTEQYYSTLENKGQNIFNQLIDAIELKNLKLKFYE